MPFDTPLTPEEESKFQNWKAWFAPKDSGHDYDLRGAFKAGIYPDPQTGHWPDTFKKPNHPTFSDQSIYSSLAGTKPGTWQGETYQPFGFNKQPSNFWKALEGVVQGIRGMQTSRANPSLFHEPTLTASQAIGPVASATGTVLADPRNAWMGLGPLATLGRASRFIKGLPEMGGFNVPTSKMVRDDPGMAKAPGLWEAEKRGDYMFGRQIENDRAATIRKGPYGDNREAFIEADDRFKHADPASQINVMRTIQGQQALKDFIDNARRSGMGGGARPPQSFGR